MPKSDARVLRSKRTLLDTVSELLVEKGMSGVSMDEVSRRSGVAKTTIYRHWSSGTELILEACASISTPQDTPFTGTLRGDLLWLVKDLAKKLRTAKWPAVLPSIVDHAERDPKLGAQYAKRQREHDLPFHVVIARGKQRGEISRKADPRVIVSQLVGPLFYRRWFSREPLDTKFAERLVDTVLAA